MRLPTLNVNVFFLMSFLEITVRIKVFVLNDTQQTSRTKLVKPAFDSSYTRAAHVVMCSHQSFSSPAPLGSPPEFPFRFSALGIKP
jgi:hypothetical protein